MKRKLINSQLDNWATYQMYLRQMLTLAENVFEFENLPTFIDMAYVNKRLLRNGSIAWFYDDVLETLLALPYRNLSSLDVYGRPRKIQVFSLNGSYTRELNPNEYVIMYDNNGQYPLYLDICQYAERIALDTRTTDINIQQQRTPRIWKCKQELEKSLKDLLNNIDGMQEKIATFTDINLDDITCILEPAPFVADKLEQHKDKVFAEFLRLIGISNLAVQKKERVITDEIQAIQGGTIASRYSRFQPRENAIKQINEKFGKYLDEPLEVRYYDGLPTTLKEFEETMIDEEVDENV